VLKSLVRSDRTQALAAGFAGFVEAYFAAATFEARPELEARAAALLPGLLLARIDGKSPVEYLVGMTPLQEAARRIARDGLLAPRERLAQLRP
jgi:hypothetical protein